MPNTTILIIEDDPLLIKMYQTKFRLEGYEVLTAGDGEAAWQILQTKPVQCVVMDVMMPRLSGMDLLARMHDTPALAKLPVLMFSNLSNPAESEKARQLGAKEFLVKANMTPGQLVTKVKEYLQS